MEPTEFIVNANKIWHFAIEITIICRRNTSARFRMRGFSSSSLLARIPVKEALELAAPGAEVAFVLRLLLVGETKVLRDARVTVHFDLHRVGVVFLTEAAIIASKTSSESESGWTSRAKESVHESLPR
eukprot:scaffold5194_cov40-Cyclotella_meneghiniana.AAC.4